MIQKYFKVIVLREIWPPLSSSNHGILEKQNCKAVLNALKYSITQKYLNYFCGFFFHRKLKKVRVRWQKTWNLFNAAWCQLCIRLTLCFTGLLAVLGTAMYDLTTPYQTCGLDLEVSPWPLTSEFDLDFDLHFSSEKK